MTRPADYTPDQAPIAKPGVSALDGFEFGSSAQREVLLATWGEGGKTALGDIAQRNVFSDRLASHAQASPLDPKQADAIMGNGNVGINGDVTNADTSADLAAKLAGVQAADNLIDRAITGEPPPEKKQAA